MPAADSETEPTASADATPAVGTATSALDPPADADAAAADGAAEKSAKWQDMETAAELVSNTDQVIIDRMGTALSLKKKWGQAGIRPR